MNNRRSASVGALPVEKKHFVSRNESASGAMPDVRCACQYFQCESLLPEKVKPPESRPSSKQGFLSDMEHGDHHQHFDNTSTRSFNVMGRQPEFDRISTGSFGGRMHGMDGRGLVVRSISDAKDPEMAGGMMAGFRGRQMSIGGMSSGSVGGRDPDAVSIRSGISLRRISRSPSHADLFVADLNIPTAHVPAQMRRGSRGEIPRLNIVAPTPTPGPGSMSPPDFSVYDRKSRPRWPERNRENLSKHHETVLPQNKPIDVARYSNTDASGRIIDQPMDVEIIEAVVDIKDNIRIDRMSPPLQQNVPDISPVVQDETRIEIRDFAPQPDLRQIDEMLADEKLPGHFDTLNIPGNRPTSPPSQFTQLKRQHAHEREMSPDYSKKQFMQRGSPTGGQPFQNEMGYSMQRGSSPAPNGRQYGPSTNGAQSFQRASSPSPNGGQYGLLPTGGQSYQTAPSTSPNEWQYGSPATGIQSFQRASSPSPNERQLGSHPAATQSYQRASSPSPNERQLGSHPAATQSYQRASSPSPNERQLGSHPAATQSYQRASSPSPNSRQFGSTTTTQSYQRASSPSPNGAQHTEARQFMQYGPGPTSTQSFQRASSPPPNRTNGAQSLPRASSPAPNSSQMGSPFSAIDSQTYQRASSPPPTTGMQHMSTGHSLQRASSPPPTKLDFQQSFQRASSPAPANGRQFMQRGSPATASQSFQRASSPSPTNAPHVDKPHDDKQSYSSRFMSMFHPKTPDPNQTPAQEKQKRTLSQHLHIGREKSPSPGKQLKPDSSPTPSRLMSVFKREKHEQQPLHATAMTVVEGSHLGNVSLKKGPEEKQHTIKVTETFSLKVDEMDQYSSHPARSPSPVRQTRLYASSDQIALAQDKLSELTDIYGDNHEPFAPVIVPSTHSSQMQLQAGDRRQYMSASQSDLRGPRRISSHEHIHPPPTTFGSNKKLISVPIAVPADFYDMEMTSSEYIHEEPEERLNYSQPSPRTNLTKAPSEQRLAQSKLLQRKAYPSNRTQSQDRAAALDCASELDTLSISTRSMTKTVSFNFGDRDSRLSQHEKMVSSNNQLDNGHWLERTYFSRDHEYEPIGEPATKTESQPTITPLVSALKKEASPAPQPQEIPKFEISQPSIESPSNEASSTPAKSDELKEAEELQKDIEDRYFSSTAIAPVTESRTDYDVYTSQADSSALEDQPMKEEIRKKSFMASAQDKTRKMQAGLKNQAGKIKTKFRSPKKVPSGSPKAKDRKRFKAPEFSKMKKPEIKRPDLSGFKRPEFTKFSKPDMSKFKLPDKFSSLKLARSKSFKESTDIEDTTVSGTTPESTNAAAPPKKQKFDFSFGTYPRAFRKKSKPQEVESTVDEPSVVLSTETQPSAESSSTPQGDRGPGPVRSRWADKFSDVSYNDSEGSRNRRYGSEQESSFDRESSMERRMKDVLDENAKEEAELAMLGVVEQKQFADYDEENRVIHEISKTREKEFRRRPMIHQDSDLVSEEGRDIGWTEREAQKNQILRKAELEAEEHFKYLTDRVSNPDTHSTASSKKFVFEEINDDEFLLRKKGLSREFNIGAQKFLDPHLEAGFDTSPSALEFIGMQSGSLNGSSIDRMDYGYDVPPPKPRRLSHQQRQRHYDSENASQIDEYADDISLSQAGSDYFRHAPPSRPLRKGRFKNSQEISIGGTPSVQFDEDEYADPRDPDRILHQEVDEEEKENIFQNRHIESAVQPPQAPRRRRKQQRDSLEKDSYVNGFGGRSVSNSYLKEDNKPEEVIVYRTEHEYKIPLATPENYTDTSTTPRKSRSLSRLGVDEEDRTSHGADSLAMELAMRDDNADLDEEELHEKYIIEMSENDGYAVVRKENLPKPTPPARRKKFSRSPGERFATMPHMRRGSPSTSEQQKSASKNYSTVGRPTPPRRRSALSLGAYSQKDFGSEDFNDYEVPELDDRTESPRNLQSGDIINKMKYRPLPPPPRPPREKRHIQRDRHGDDDDEFDGRDDQDDRDGGGEKIVFDLLNEQNSYDYNLEQNIDKSIEVEVSTQTDPLPDDFVCDEFEITDDMKVIEPRRTKTLDEILREEEQADLERAKQIDEEVLQRGIQRFREANQRSASEKSRASSQAKSLSRPQTPSAILIEKRVPTPVPNSNGQSVLEASLTVQPIDDLDLEEELLRKEGLYDGSHSKSDADSRQRDDREAGHGSDEENENVGEEERSYSRSTDAKSQQYDEEDQEKRLEEERLLVQRLLEEDKEEQRLLEMIRKEKEDERTLVQRLMKEQEEEQELLERIRREQKWQEEEERRLKEDEHQRLLQEEEKFRKEENLQKEEERRLEEDEHQRLLEEEEKIRKEENLQKEGERRLLEEEHQRLMLEEEEEKQRIQQEKEELKQRLQDYLDREQRLHQESRSDEHESYDDEPIDRLKVEDSYELRSELSEEKEIPTSPSVSPLPPRVDEVVSVQHEGKIQEHSQPQEEPSSPPPTAPRRKRSSGAALVEDQSELLSVTEPQPHTVPFTGVMPSHLALADLEVERLRVHALQAGQVMVSHLHGTHIQADELECRSGNLVVNNIEFPPGFIENIVERVRSTEREHSQAGTQTIAEARTQTEEDSIPPPPIPTRQPDLPPVRPPPPQREHLIYPPEYMQAAQSAVFPRSVLPSDYMQTVPPVGFYNHRHPDDDDGEPAPTPFKRRRHYRRRDSSSEEGHTRRRSRSARPEQQTVSQAGRQFISACSLPLTNVINQLTNAVRPNNDNKQEPVQPRNISTVVVIFIIMTLTFLLYLLSGKNIHHHHWDYFNPPGNDGRLS